MVSSPYFPIRSIVSLAELYIQAGDMDKARLAYQVRLTPEIFFNASGVYLKQKNYIPEAAAPPQAQLV